MSAQEEPRSVGDCAEVVLRMFEYVDKEAGQEDTTRIKQHLDACNSCLREYESDLLLKEMIRRACNSEQAPPQLRTQIMARITTVVTTTQQRHVQGG